MVEHIVIRSCEFPECKNEEDITSNSGTFKVCGKCRSAKYCSKQCQEKHWSIHKKFCFDKNSNVNVQDNMETSEQFCRFIGEERIQPNGIPCNAVFRSFNMSLIPEIFFLKTNKL